MAWVRCLIFTPEKQADVYWMLNTALQTLQNAKLDSTVFDFVPEFYIEAICSGYSALRNLFSPTVSFNDLPGMVRNYSFLFTGMGVLRGGGGVRTPLALARGGAIFHDKAKNNRDKMRCSNLSNNMMISKL
jgi:hypothetical protein